MKRWSWVFVCWLLGCGDDPAHVEEHPELRAYIESFAEEAALHGRSVNPDRVTTEWFVNEIEMSYGGQSLGSTRGWCVVGDRGQPHVMIEKKWWEDYTHMEKERLMFHELGHCLLGRDHTSNLLSLMYPHLNQIDYNEETREMYLFELFSTNRLRD